MLRGRIVRQIKKKITQSGSATLPCVEEVAELDFPSVCDGMSEKVSFPPPDWRKERVKPMVLILDG